MKHLKTPQELNEALENLNISDVRSSKKIYELYEEEEDDSDGIVWRPLSSDEKKWLKDWLHRCNNQWGFEPKDYKYMKKILYKLYID